MTQHQLVVLVTDKNLGCAVAPRTWIIDKTTHLLSSNIDYECISYDTAVVLMRNKIKAVQELAELAEYSVCYSTSTQLSDFFQRQILDPFDENLWKLPKFYVIPKIHETPVSARPILPCYSVVQGPAGKFVSKMLKGIVKTKQGIIHGSKDLALKLYSLKSLSPSNFAREMKRLYFISGDVIAFYPNVDVQKAY